VVRPTVSPIQARVLGAVLGVTGFAFASVSGFAAAHVAADTHIPDGKIWVTKDGSKDGPPAGDTVRKFDCGDIDVQTGKLNESSGHFDIVFDDHDGKDRTIVDGAEWHFDKDKHADQQVIFQIDGKELISKMEDKGFHPQDDGWHMDLNFNNGRVVEFILEDNCESEHGGGGGESNAPVPVQQQAPPPPVVKGTTTQAPKAAVVPQTGADAPFLTGLLLMSAGSGALGFARRLRRRGR